jgi:hypothetical protein
LEFWFIPDIKSPSRLAICYRSRLDDVAAGPLHYRNPIKRNPCRSLIADKRQHRAQVGTSSRSCTSCLSSASGCCLQHMFQDFKLLMLSKFVIASRCSRLVVIVLCLVSANFQQVMSLGHGDSSRSSSTAKRRISSQIDVQQQESVSSLTC